MKRLILMRHSHAENGNQGTTDLERKLTSKGILTIANQANKLKGTTYYPDCILASHALRANQTASILAEKLDFDKAVTINPYLYEEYSANEFIEYLKQLSDSDNTVLIVGHNPSISYMCHMLTQTNSESFSPATMAILNMNVNSWTLVEMRAADIEHFFGT